MQSPTRRKKRPPPKQAPNQNTGRNLSELPNDVILNFHRFRNFLKLPKARLWLMAEFFTSNVDSVLLRSNELECCIRERFPNLSTRLLTRKQWVYLRRALGKPRRCSPSFFYQERLTLESRRHRISALQAQRSQVYLDEDIRQEDLTDLPELIPMPPPLGSKVTVVLMWRQPNGIPDGLYTGVVEAVNPDQRVWTVRFSKTELAVLAVPDFCCRTPEPVGTVPLEVFRSKTVECLPTGLFPKRFATPLAKRGFVVTPFFEKPRGSSGRRGRGVDYQGFMGAPYQQMVQPASPDRLTNAYSVLGSPGRREPAARPLHTKIKRSLSSCELVELSSDGYPELMLNSMVQLHRLLIAKSKKCAQLHRLNNEAEQLRALDQPIAGQMQSRFAQLILDMDRLNGQLRSLLAPLDLFSRQLAPPHNLAEFDFADELQRKCSSDAQNSVALSNEQLPRPVEHEGSLQLISNLVSVLLQIKTYTDADLVNFEQTSLQESIEAIKSRLSPANRSRFQSEIEVHLNHIQAAMTASSGGLH